jgi:hypothetical protein
MLFLAALRKTHSTSAAPRRTASAHRLTSWFDPTVEVAETWQLEERAGIEENPDRRGENPEQARNLRRCLLPMAIWYLLSDSR